MVKPKRCSDDIAKPIVDPSAETLEEICHAHPEMGVGTIRRLVRAKVASGAWEQVWKKNAKDNHLIRAYRRAT